MDRSTLLYDRIGKGYAERRRADPRIEARIRGVLGDARSVVNVGAGAGSYEPGDRRVVAVEPSRTQIGQRPKGSAPAVRAVAEALPFGDKSFDAAMAVLSVHHWSDPKCGLAELARVARRRAVILTWEPAACRFWLFEEYLPEIHAVDAAIFPAMSAYRDAFGERVRVEPIPIPHDCRDGFMCAYWRRPEAYLDASIRGAMSTFAKIGDPSAAVERLRRDIESGAWQERHAELFGLESLDLGYRLVIAEFD
jgi:SAM-dependent methyltransferase